VLDGAQSVVKMTSGYFAVLFISINQMHFLVPTLANVDPIFGLVITPGLIKTQQWQSKKLK